MLQQVQVRSGCQQSPPPPLLLTLLSFVMAALARAIRDLFACCFSSNNKQVKEKEDELQLQQQQGEQQQQQQQQKSPDKQEGETRPDKSLQRLHKYLLSFQARWDTLAEVILLLENRPSAEGVQCFVSRAEYRDNVVPCKSNKMDKNRDSKAKDKGLEKKVEKEENFDDVNQDNGDDDDAPEELPVVKGGDGEVADAAPGPGPWQWVEKAAEDAKQDMEDDCEENEEEEDDGLSAQVRDGARQIRQLGLEFMPTGMADRWHETDTVRGINVYHRFVIEE